MSSFKSILNSSSLNNFCKNVKNISVISEKLVLPVTTQKCQCFLFHPLKLRKPCTTITIQEEIFQKSLLSIKFELLSSKTDESDSHPPHTAHILTPIVLKGPYHLQKSSLSSPLFNALLNFSSAFYFLLPVPTRWHKALVCKQQPIYCAERYLGTSL